MGSVARSPPVTDRKTKVIISKIIKIEKQRLINCPRKTIRVNTPNSAAPPVSSIGNLS